MKKRYIIGGVVAVAVAIYLLTKKKAVASSVISTPSSVSSEIVNSKNEFEQRMAYKQSLANKGISQGFQ